MQVECNFCHKQFEIKQRTRKVHQYVVGFFQCPHCKHEYIAYVTDRETQRMQSRRRYLLSQIQKANAPNGDRSHLEAMEKEYESLNGGYIKNIVGQHIKIPGKIAERMDQLKKEYLASTGAN